MTRDHPDFRAPRCETAVRAYYRIERCWADRSVKEPYFVEDLRLGLTLSVGRDQMRSLTSTSTNE